MPKQRRSRRSAQARHLQFAWAVPFVMADRMARLMLPQPSARDRAELRRMVSEKPLAFQEAWVAMARETASVQYRLAAAWWTAALRVWSSGLVPVQRRAIANARRLSR